MDTTPIYSLPYAESGDLVQDFPANVSKPLAEEVESALSALDVISVDTSVGTRVTVRDTLVYAETGWREVSGSVFTENWTVESVQLRRTLDRVTVRMGGVAPLSGSTNSAFLDIGVGWRRDQRSTLVPYATNLSTSSLGVAMIFTGRIDLPTGTTTRPGYYAEFSYTTADDWPASLPGTPG